VDGDGRLIVVYALRPEARGVQALGEAEAASRAFFMALEQVGEGDLIRIGVYIKFIII